MRNTCGASVPCCGQPPSLLALANRECRRRQYDEQGPRANNEWHKTSILRLYRCRCRCSMLLYSSWIYLGWNPTSSSKGSSSELDIPSDHHRDDCPSRRDDQVIHSFERDHHHSRPSSRIPPVENTSKGEYVLKSRLWRTDSRRAVRSKVLCVQSHAEPSVLILAVKTKTEVFRIDTIGQVDDNIKKARGLCAG